MLDRSAKLLFAFIGKKVAEMQGKEEVSMKSYLEPRAYNAIPSSSSSLFFLIYYDVKYKTITLFYNLRPIFIRKSSLWWCNIHAGSLGWLAGYILRIV